MPQHPPTCTRPQLRSRATFLPTPNPSLALPRHPGAAAAAAPTCTMLRSRSVLSSATSRSNSSPLRRSSTRCSTCSKQSRVAGVSVQTPPRDQQHHAPSLLHAAAAAAARLPACGTARSDRTLHHGSASACPTAAAASTHLDRHQLLAVVEALVASAKGAGAQLPEGAVGPLADLNLFGLQHGAGAIVSQAEEKRQALWTAAGLQPGTGSGSNPNPQESQVPGWAAGLAERASAVAPAGAP